MRVKIGGHDYEIDAAKIRRSLESKWPRPVQVHWVEIDGVRWPPAQVLELTLKPPRRDYTTHRAIGVLRRLGFNTSALPVESTGQQRRNTPVKPTPRPPVSFEELVEAVGALDRFVGALDLTDRLANLEAELYGATRETAAAVVNGAGIGNDTLAAALLVRERLGRVSDVVHASVIALALPTLLEPGEVLNNRPSLAAGNDPSRPFDLETNVRVAEFKLSVWKGADAMRQRGAFKDLVALALDDSGRRAQLFVVGDVPGHYLSTTVATASWGLSRGSTNIRKRFIERWGEAALDLSIAEFRRTRAAHIEVIDVRTVLDGLHAQG